METHQHIPVLLDEVVTALKPYSGGRYIDATVGTGGHAAAILDASEPNGRLLGIDQDPLQIERAHERLQSYGNRCVLRTGRFGDIATVARGEGFESVDGVLFDFGVSSRQLDDPAYGLGFRDNDALDMRLSPGAERTAAELLSRTSRQALADLLFQYGDRHNSYQLADRIIDYRRRHGIATAGDLKQALGLERPRDLAPIWQALRITVNDEYGQITAGLEGAIRLLRPGGVLAAISFHSGEDRLVKQTLRQNVSELSISKAITVASRVEQRKNPRSRSAKLRLAHKRS